ncbi:uncharacterized protein THITE_114562 [Thermothielavioides terrestris NRRL 8126]|uniref:Uncharacterized protein n=1 Tax=Thermothielavioides terrestris (strain ATCC 38088 / NRRL 8126) TaxID=578455 RepID=G2RDD7_THETT|nr:uncharacterized protein THITE_114562 [Thermothielavioides terrestris NRRL 8126]AEO70776.1 hypothetical protein THITE_114562 [Thermothielavioides terrestris NRRL 8126]
MVAGSPPAVLMPGAIWLRAGTMRGGRCGFAQDLRQWSPERASTATELSASPKSSGAYTKVRLPDTTFRFKRGGRAALGATVEKRSPFRTAPAGVRNTPMPRDGGTSITTRKVHELCVIGFALLVPNAQIVIKERPRVCTSSNQKLRSGGSTRNESVAWQTGFRSSTPGHGASVNAPIGRVLAGNQLAHGPDMDAGESEALRPLDVLDENEAPAKQTN